MKFDEILAFIFGKKGLALLLITVLACMIFATACDLSDFFTEEDVNKVCAGWDDGDCMMLCLCGCINPVYLCNFTECVCDKACDGVDSCTDSCNESIKNGISNACDSCLGLCGTSQEEQIDCTLDCMDDCYTCIFCIDTSETCEGCGESFDRDEAYVSYGSRFCPHCFYRLGPA